ncbi:MAG TPA: DUF92 domain-containing protein [Thermoflexia bacterium]|jgi:uncharacterized protein (TIGR00297 family)|nr:DUF92 domain-containing protein [Thermoflexia bacterium]
MENLPSWPNLVSGLVLSAVIAAVAYRREALSPSGVVGALLSGTVMFGLGGWEWGLLLIGFFISSSLLSLYRAEEKAGLAEKFAKGHRRDLGQALANAGVGMGLAVASLFWSRPLLYGACAGAMAAVNADTWATEIGVLSRKSPRLITTGRRVEVGTSGGVTGLGMLVSLAGAAFIGLLAAVGAWFGAHSASVATAAFVGGTVGGTVGSLFDSLLGATWQGIYWCPRCEKETERPLHRCGTAAQPVRGYTWLGNDLVNFLSSVAGALVAAGIGWLYLGNLG